MVSLCVSTLTRSHMLRNTSHSLPLQQDRHLRHRSPQELLISFQLFTDQFDPLDPDDSHSRAPCRESLRQFSPIPPQQHPSPQHTPSPQLGRLLMRCRPLTLGSGSDGVPLLATVCHRSPLSCRKATQSASNIATSHGALLHDVSAAYQCYLP